MPDKIKYFGSGPRGGDIYVFRCPACGLAHPFEIGTPLGAGWFWNGSLARPTFSPSLMIGDGTSHACHSYVTDGKIQFLRDSHHSLSGQTVELPDWN